jgi:hypothetical protein
MNLKIPFYNDKWDVELYDTNYNQIFPCEDSAITPVDLVPKLSKVACTIQCTGLWIGGKGWGLTWKLIQAVVKAKETENIRGKCQIKLSDDDKKTFDTPEVDNEDQYMDETPVQKAPVDTTVEDSDEETETPPVAVSVPVEVVSSEPPKVVKKIVKKKVIS